MTPFALAERDRVLLGLNPALLFLLSHAQDDLVRFVKGQTSFGTQRRPPIPLGRDHEGSDKTLHQPSDDLEDNHWRTGKMKSNAEIN
ncbi:hypothetical protein [Blastomonas sp. RAC04]|uniref:hypothetical protein n=1 Tax=Blastomonas sp. RAC04 TaxID=1842535 RepID=UPI0012376609|nr:hypothetical protein [Blastomonas sp. RAC04]